MAAEPGLVLRPYGHLFRQGVIATVACMLPVFLVLYFLTIPDGTWLPVLVTQVVATIVVTWASAAYFTTTIRVTDTQIIERGFFGRTTRYRLDEIVGVVRANTFGSGGFESIPQLFVCGPDGRQLVRMRGQFWSPQSMDALTSALDVPVTVVPDTVTNRELRAEHPGLLYWFERGPLS